VVRIKFNFADRLRGRNALETDRRDADRYLARDVLCGLARPWSCNMQSQQSQIGDLPQSAASFWQKLQEECALAYAFYLLLADLELEEVFAEFIVREELNQMDSPSAGSQPTM